ncbi:MAG TPA: TatD family hydrolase [Verrucomicrobiae bacterium]|jgi:TatD DNase family protein
MKLYDAHNHLQDPRLKPHLPAIMSALQSEPIARMTVNGTSEEDWPAVLELARKYPQVLPSFGCHPWHVKNRTPRWQAELLRHLDAVPSPVGEIGLDRWIKGCDMPAQEEAFVWQLRLAAERQLPVSIHCLQAWGKLVEILQRGGPLPAGGFLLHSYAGSPQLVPGLVKLGAYFSLPGAFARERKACQRETFLQVPLHRLLVETDAPDQLPPAERIRIPLLDGGGQALNHPANLGAVYQFAADLWNMPLEKFAAQIEANYLRFFAMK